MKRLPVFCLFATLVFSGCNIYHYSKVIPGENVVFSDNSTVSGAGESNYQAFAAPSSSAATSSTVASQQESAPAADNQAAPVVTTQSQPTAVDGNGVPAWTRKQSYDEIERGKQIFFGVGLSYYQAPTKKELDKARTKAEQNATDHLTSYVLANFSNTPTPLEGVTVVDTWQDLEQMALYTLVRYVNK